MLFYIRLLNAENKYFPNIKNTCKISVKHKKENNFGSNIKITRKGLKAQTPFDLPTYTFFTFSFTLINKSICFLHLIPKNMLTLQFKRLG